ncbi:hypothetical protein ACH5RR_021384 [Cinchona calisaya]|uniref:Uncharacterized protein n=1 Tax=Cinchona calisaya TaxID=153742 RepID=A0ABD2ZH53_9GENT
MFLLSFHVAQRNFWLSVVYNGLFGLKCRPYSWLLLPSDSLCLLCTRSLLVPGIVSNTMLASGTAVMGLLEEFDNKSTLRRRGLSEERVQIDLKKWRRIAKLEFCASARSNSDTVW